jgi:hypothetical protein
MNSSLFTLRSSLNHRSVLSVDGGSKGDNHLFHTSIDGCKGILQLRNHAACHGTICFISLKIGMGNHWKRADFCSFLYFAICKERLNSRAKIRYFS